MMDNKQTKLLLLFFTFALNIIFCQGQVPVPNNFAVSSVTETSATLTWTAPSSGTGYSITTTGASGGAVGSAITLSTLTTITYTIPGLTVGTTYTFTIQTADSSSSSTSRAISVSGTPLPKASVIAPTQTAGQGVVTWAVTIATITPSPQLLLTLSQGGNTVIQTLSTTTPIIVSGLSNLAYTPSVTALLNNYRGETFGGSAFTPSGITTPASPPAPTNANAVFKGTTLTVSWTAAASVAGYLVTISTDAVPYYVDGSNTATFSLSNLSPCTVYSITIKTTATGPATSTAVALTGIQSYAPAVGAITATEASPVSGKVTVTWNPITLSGACSWTYFLTLTDTTPTQKYKAFPPVTGSSYELYNVATANYIVNLYTSANTAVGAVVTANFNKASFTAGASVPAPTNVISTSQTTTTITLSWTPVSSAVGYQYTTSSDSVPVIIDGGAVSGATISSLTACTTYTITVNALLASSISPGVQVTASTAPSPPTNLVVQSSTNGVITATWTPNAICQSTFYVLGTSSSNSLAVTTAVSATTADLFPAKPSTTYNITVSPIFQGTQGSPAIMTFAVPSFTPTAAPSDPTNLQITQQATSITFTWTAPAGTIKGYGISATPVGSTLAPLVITSASPYTLTAPVCTVYNVIISALTADNSSPGLKAYTGTVLPVVNNVVVTPIANQNGYISVAWNAVTASANCVFDSYFIQLVVQGSTTIYQTAGAFANATSASINFLPSGAIYTVRVYTKKFNLLSSSSADQSITIPTYTTTLATTTTTTAPAPSTLLVGLSGKVYDQFGNELIYTSDLANAGSALFVSLSTSLCQATQTALKASTTYSSAYQACYVTNFTSGSVIGNQVVVLAKSTSLSPISNTDFTNLAASIVSTILKTPGSTATFGSDLKVVVTNFGNRNVYTISSILLLATIMLVNLCNRL